MRERFNKFLLALPLFASSTIPVFGIELTTTDGTKLELKGREYLGSVALENDRSLVCYQLNKSSGVFSLDPVKVSVRQPDCRLEQTGPAHFTLVVNGNIVMKNKGVVTVRELHTGLVNAGVCTAVNW